MSRKDPEVRRLQREASAGLGWVTGRLDSFSPIRRRALSEGGIKIFAELAVVYAYLHRSVALPLRQHLPVWEDFLTTQCSRPSFAELTRKQAHLAFPCLVPYLLLRTTGYRDSFYEQTIARVRRSGHLRVSEAVPYRALEREFMLWKAGVAQEPAWMRLYRGTSLQTCRSALSLDDDGAYSVTHTLFYLTDFGYQPLPLPGQAADRAASLVEALLLHYWRIGHWDLVGELLINMNCLGRRESVIYKGAESAFSSVRRPDGAVPATRREPPGAEFSRYYHSTLVSILHCGTAMQRILSKGQ